MFMKIAAIYQGFIAAARSRILSGILPRVSGRTAGPGTRAKGADCPIPT